MLWRALQHVEGGFYIDVGAADPDTDSVTRAFYERGWHGVNVEPVGSYHERLEARRPLDTNLRAALASTPGRDTLHVVDDSGLSTLDPALAQRHATAGWSTHPVEVKVDTLANICDAHVRGEIHFLKLDVEGGEKEVLQGADFTRWRPWIVAVEATEPNTQTPNHQGWEPLLTQADYDFVYFDGLNRFYVAREHASLKAAFATPPNAFDDFIPDAVEHARAEVDAARNQAREAHDEAVRLTQQVAKLRAERDSARDRAREQTRAAPVATPSAAEQQTRLQMAALLETVQSLARDVTGMKQALEAAQTSARRHDQVAAELEAAQAIACHRDQIAAELAAVYTSTSWRLTRPLRVLMRMLRRPAYISEVGRLALSRIKPMARRGVAKMVRVVLSHPRLYSLAVRTLRRFPALDKRVRSLASRTLNSASAHTTPLTADTLPREARRWHAALKRVTNPSN